MQRAGEFEAVQQWRLAEQDNFGIGHRKSGEEEEEEGEIGQMNGDRMGEDDWNGDDLGG